MKSKFAVIVILFGWFIVIAYMIYDYDNYGSNALRHFFVPEGPAEIFFHIMILSALVGSIITGYLINERKKLLDKTQLSEKKYRHAAEEWRATVDSLPYGVMLTDNEFNIIKANNYIADLAGIPIKELTHKKCYEIIHKDNKPVDCCPLVKLIETRRAGAVEYYDPDRRKYFLTSVSPIFDDKGNVIAYSHPLIDITDIKLKEKKLTQSKDAFLNMLKDITSAYKELRGLQHNLIIAFANALDAKSPWTRGHSERVTNYAISIAKEMGVSEKDIDALWIAGLLHDIGKIGTYDIILEKPTKLTDEEFALVKKHTIKGEEILSPIKELEGILPIIRSHHEKVDGTGYPDGLKGDEIPLLAKILCVADSYDSMKSDRPYRPAPNKGFSLSELKRCSGTHFDPEVVEAFLRVLEKE